MNTFKIKGESIDELINADYIKINKYGQTEIWKDYSLIGVFNKDVSVFEII